MNKKDQHWRKSRQVMERIIVEGELELLTPAHFGCGDTEGLADLALLRDPYQGQALLPGASIAGALRSYWRERTGGYGAEATDTDLFGAKRGARDDMKGSQSLLIVEDSIGPDPQIELREGVRIDDETRTALEGHLFDMELLQAGTRFELRFELLVPEDKDRTTLCQNLALALQGFEQEEIHLGARKQRGFGRCRVSNWRVRRYDFTASNALLAWLAEGRDWPGAPTVAEARGKTLAEKLGVFLPDLPDRRERFLLSADFALESSLLVRSGFGQADQGADTVHLHRPRYGSDGAEPVLPGTSLAGALRARARRIANTLTRDEGAVEALINGLFGVGPEDTEEGDHRASRLATHEAVIHDIHTLVQNRIRIDRFTGGAMDNYLFNEAPVFNTEPGRENLTLEIALRQPQAHEIGLLLLLLKDLWTADLPLGGESGIGRGRLQGLAARLKHQWFDPEKSETVLTAWQLADHDGRLKVEAEGQTEAAARAGLQEFVDKLQLQLTGRIDDAA